MAPKQLRKRRTDDSDDDEDEVEDPEELRIKLEDMKEAQKIRQRQNGVSVAALALGKKFTSEEEVSSDPFKLKTGGIVDMKRIRDRNRDRTGEENEKDITSLGTSFSAETNRRDEDADMMKYIETELKRRKGQCQSVEQSTKLRSAEDLLYELPENLQVASARRTEEMLSNQMLSGIPEVDLGIDSKIQNIEVTEEAKQQLLAEQRRRKQERSTSFVPSNMAVNYVQHNRFSHEQLGHNSRRGYHREESRPKPANSPGRRRPHADKASDDFHYERFRKMNRRY
uniref:splicing factor C9orf78 homolog n=1 Tax=Myxine glutinosa TaxID=7769 RepID=UPI00358ECCD8